jgi:serine/threonine protein kinase
MCCVLQIHLVDEDKFGAVVIPNVKENDDLFELLFAEPLREEYARELAKQIFAALNACHEKNIAHRYTHTRYA